MPNLILQLIQQYIIQCICVSPCSAVDPVRMKYLVDGESIVFGVGVLKWEQKQWNLCLEVNSLKTDPDVKISVKVIYYEVLPGEITGGMEEEGKRGGQAKRGYRI